MGGTGIGSRGRDEVDGGVIRLLIRRMEEVMLGLEKANMAEYVAIYRNPKRYLAVNFLGGVIRGFGLAVGYAVVAALFISLLFYAAKLNLPLVGNYVADIAEIVRHKLY